MLDGNENECTLTAGVLALTRTLRQTSPCFAQPDTTLVLKANRGQRAEAIRTAAFRVILRGRNAPWKIKLHQR